MRYAIKKVPNNAETIAAIESILPDDVKVTSRRGRGFRRGLRHYHQSLPINLAAYLTIYAADAANIKRYPWGSLHVEGYEINQYTYRGTRNGKPVLRCERRDHIAKPYQLR